MASHVAGSSTRREARSGFGSGWLVFAAVLMVFGGLMMAVAGISAIADDDVFVATRNYVWELDLAGWGWIHLVMGIVIFFAGSPCSGAPPGQGSSVWHWPVSA